jgi:hypothetical protein
VGLLLMVGMTLVLLIDPCEKVTYGCDELDTGVILPVAVLERKSQVSMLVLLVSKGSRKIVGLA